MPSTIQTTLAVCLATLLIAPTLVAAGGDATVTGTGAGLWLTCNKPIPPNVPGPLLPAPACSPTPRVLSYAADPAGDTVTFVGATATGTSPFPTATYALSTECTGDIAGAISCASAESHIEINEVGLVQYGRNGQQFPLLVGAIVRLPAAPAPP